MSVFNSKLRPQFIHSQGYVYYQVFSMCVNCLHWYCCIYVGFPSSLVPAQVINKHFHTNWHVKNTIKIGQEAPNGDKSESGEGGCIPRAAMHATIPGRDNSDPAFWLASAGHVTTARQSVIMAKCSRPGTVGLSVRPSSVSRALSWVPILLTWPRQAVGAPPHRSSMPICKVKGHRQLIQTMLRPTHNTGLWVCRPIAMLGTILV